jgi:phage terminase large subunit
MVAVRGYMYGMTGVSGILLCGRQFMNSLDDSSMEEVKQAIAAVPWLDAYFDCGEKFIRTRNRRVTYAFTGLRHSLDGLKGKARVLIAWIDEAESVSETAWLKLGPTVREEGSEIWATWNPEKDGSATDKRWRKSAPAGTRVAQVNFADNPWFPAVLEEQRRHAQATLDEENGSHYRLEIHRSNPYLSPAIQSAIIERFQNLDIADPEDNEDPSEF